MIQNRIREIRKLRNITLNELALRVGAPYSTIQKLDACMVDLDTKWMEKLSKALGCKPYELLPIEWQPETVSEADLQMLRAIKSYASDQTDANKTQNPTQQKESER